MKPRPGLGLILRVRILIPILLFQTALGPMALALPQRFEARVAGNDGLSGDPLVREAQLAAQPIQERLLAEARQVLLGQGMALPETRDPLNVSRQYITIVENG